MSDIWPPPPQNQTANEPSTSWATSGHAAFFCASTGTLMLGLALFAYMHKHLAEVDFSMVSLTIVSGLTLVGIALPNFGGWLGSRAKGTTSGRVAVAVWLATNFVFALFSFLSIMYGQDF